MPRLRQPHRRRTAQSAGSGCTTSGSARQPAAGPATAQADPKPASRANGLKPYRDVVPATAQTDAGLFTVHAVDDKVLLEIPDSLFGRDMLLVSRIAQAPTDLHPFLSGGASVTTGNGSDGIYQSLAVTAGESIRTIPLHLSGTLAARCARAWCSGRGAASRRRRAIRPLPCWPP